MKLLMVLFSSADTELLKVGTGICNLWRFGWVIAERSRGGSDTRGGWRLRGLYGARILMSLAVG